MWPRLWFGDGGSLDLPKVEREQMAAFEASWKGYARVEWLATPKGRLDRIIPQNLILQVHNANARTPPKHARGRNVT
jgi:hypothetical protein